MKKLMLLGLLGVGLAAAPAAQAAPVAWGFGIGVGPVYAAPPVCAYGYYPYYPYACAPYGYYGPEWFSGGVFIGAGPWFHGSYGHPGYPARGYYGHPAFRGGPVARGYAHAPVGGGVHGGYAHSFRGGTIHGGSRR